MPQFQYMVSGTAHPGFGQPWPRCPQSGQIRRISLVLLRHVATPPVHPGPPSTMELSATLVDLATAANKPATFASYRRSWRLCVDFTTAHNIIPLDAQIPISSHIIALFVPLCPLYNKGLQTSSIRSHLSALAYSHHMQGYGSLVTVSWSLNLWKALRYCHLEEIYATQSLLTFSVNY